MRASKFAAALYAALLLTPAHAADGLNTVAQFAGGDSELDVQTYEKDGKKAAILEMVAGSQRASFVLDAQTGEQFYEIWTKAKTFQAGSWYQVGTVAESRAANASIITVSAGIGVRMVLSDAKQGLFTHVLPREEMAPFDEALQKAFDFLKS